jgi:threonine dehydrogenase-like Zn-dependent dehydrogenase
MKAVAVFPGLRETRVIDVDRPALDGPTQVLLRVIEVGICGTDREIASFEYGTQPDGSDYLVIGHEAVAEVVETGPAVESLRPGDIVVPMVRRPCPHEGCVPCRSGRPDFCHTGDFLERGIKHAHGFMTEFVVDDEAYLARVPAAIADVAALVEPLTVTAKAGQQLAVMSERLPYEPLRQRALIIGAGAVGLLGAMFARAREAETYVFSREPADSERAALVESFGAHYISSQDVPVEELTIEHGTFDTVFEAAGSAALAFRALSALGPNGTFIFTGVPAVGRKDTIDLGRVMRSFVLNNQAVFGTVNAGRSAYEAAIQALEQFLALFPESVRRLITARVPIEAVPGLLHRSDGIKSVVEMHRPDARAKGAVRQTRAAAR